MKKLLDVKSLIKHYHIFCEGYLKKQIRQYQSGTIDYIIIDFEELVQYDHNIFDMFLENPVEHFDLIKITLNIHFKETAEDDDFHITFANVNKFSKINLSHIRSEDVGKLISVKGMIKRKSISMIRVTHLEYLCTNPDCTYSTDRLRLPQTQEKLQTLKACPRCKAPVDLINQVKVDYQQIFLEESPDELDNSSILPESKLIELYGKLTEPKNNERFLVGSKIEVVGIIREKVKQEMGRDTTLSHAFVEALDIISLEEDIFRVEITVKDKEDFQDLAKKENILGLLRDSVAPNIAGRQEIKEGTLLYVVGGSRVDGERDLIHILTIGNPGVGKSQILKRLKKLLPRAVYISAENATGAGMIGAAVKDEMTKSWTIEAGAMVQANNGYFLIDEFDKASKSDQDHLHQGLEHQEVTINKAGILANLKTYCPCYGVANPKHSKFDESKDYASQLTFKTSLLSRFDLVFIIDSQDTDKEHKEIMRKVLKRGKSTKDDIIGTEKLRKYLMYAKSLKPVISDDLLDHIEKYFDTIFKQSKDLNSIEIGYRQLAGLIRMSEAYAKLHLRTKVIKDDVKKAIDLMSYTLKKFGVSSIETGMSNKTRSKLRTVETAIDELAETQKIFTISEVKTKAKTLNESLTDIEIEKTMENLKTAGVIFEPQRGKYRKVK